MVAVLVAFEPPAPPDALASPGLIAWRDHARARFVKVEIPGLRLGIYAQDRPCRATETKVGTRDPSQPASFFFFFFFFFFLFVIMGVIFVRERCVRCDRLMLPMCLYLGVHRVMSDQFIF